MYFPSEPIRVLLVDDDPVFIGRAAQALRPFARIRTVTSGSAALTTIPFWQPNVILFDLLMTDLDGFSFLEAVPKVPVQDHPFILCTTDGLGAGTRVRPLPNWRVGTLLRSSSIHQLRVAVLQAARWQLPLSQDVTLAVSGSGVPSSTGQN
jgi:CheY-like chemotaxis protein